MLPIMRSLALATAVVSTSIAITSAPALAQAPTATAPSASGRVRNIVLVHGMGSDGSVWRPVYDILKAKGYNVSIVPEPLNGFEQDVKQRSARLRNRPAPSCW